MPTVKLPIQSLNAGVSKRASSKRLPQEVEEADNVLLTVERSAEKRPPFTQVRTNTDGNYLDVNYLTGMTPPDDSNPLEYWNQDNLYYHFVDIDGANRFCIIINRAVTAANQLVNVFRITPTEWIKQEFDYNSLDRGMQEYLKYYNLQVESTLPADEILGSLTYGSSAIFYNKKKEIKMLPDNSIYQLPPDPDQPTYYELHPGYIQSGSKFAYKIADSYFVNTDGTCANGPTGQCGPWHLPGTDLEDLPYVTYGEPDEDGLFSKYISAVAAPGIGGGWKNVTEDIESRVNEASLEAYAVGHSVENFSKIKIPPNAGDMNSHAGFKAQMAMAHLYHRGEGGIPNTIATGAAAAVANIIINGKPADQNYLDIRNGIDESGDGRGQLYRFKFDHSEDHSMGSVNYDSEDRIVIGLNGIGDGTSESDRLAIRTRFANVLSLTKPFTRVAVSSSKAKGSTTITINGTPATGEDITISALKANGTLETVTFDANNTLDAGTFTSLEFSQQGTTAEIATALKECILASLAGPYFSVTLADGGNVIGLTQVNGGEAGNTTVTNNLANVVAPNFSGGKEDLNLSQQDLGTLGNTAILLKNASDDQIVSDAALSITGFAGGLDAPDYGYLTSPFPDITKDGSIFSFPNANTQGKGEIWYTRDPWFTFPPGHYRTVSDPNYGQPYYQQVRTEDRWGVVDHRTMPVQIYLGSDDKWRCKYVPWKPRLSGTSINNPGPEAFGNEEKTGEKIAAMEVWKGRLWVATDTHLFSSKTSDYFNFFIDDITNITDADPIDLTVNTGQFNLVQSLTAFQNFLFITTKSGNQFEVRGSASAGGMISPSTIELRSTSFYSTASTANPVKMGSNIFFFDTEKLFLYSGTDAFGNEYSSAYELSQHVRGYLPETFRCVSAIPSENTIIMIDDDMPSDMYFYTQKVNAGNLVQSAFYRWQLDPADSIQYVGGFESSFYVIVKRSRGPSQGLYVYYGTLEPVTLATPMLDRLIKVNSDDITFDAATNTTSILVPFFDPNITEVVTTEDWNITGGAQKAYSRYKIIATQNVVYDNHYKTEITVSGNLAQQYAGSSQGLQDRTLWVGKPYTMNITLSTQHYRDNQGVAREGVLNLKRLTSRHKDTGQYDIQVTRYNRKTSSVRSEAFSLNDTTDLLGGIRIESEGELLSKILGNAESTKIQITSDYPTPCNITSLEFIGTHKHGNTSIQK